MTWIWDAPYFGPLCTAVGGLLAFGGKLWLDRRKARREEAKIQHEAGARVFDAGAQDKFATAAERAAQRDHEIVTTLIGGVRADISGLCDEVAELRASIANIQPATHAATLAWIAEERRIADERVEKAQAKIERMADKVLTALAAVGTKAEIKQG